MKTNLDYEAGTPRTAPDDYAITIVEGGPYMIHGKMPIKLQAIVYNEDGNSWSFRESVRNFQTSDSKLVALCRCGASHKKPYCDGSHVHLDWDSRLTASHEPLLDGAQTLEGPSLTLTDNRKYCAYARFCDAKGSTWEQNARSNDPNQRELAIRTANHCPAGRLKEWDSHTRQPIEAELKPQIGLIEDPELQCSGPIWVMGGIPITTPDGFTYQVRNRVTLCRCGNSSNKPFCDGTHASSRFQDGLKDE